MQHIYDLLSTSIERILSCLNRKIMHQFYLKMFLIRLIVDVAPIFFKLTTAWIFRRTCNTCYDTDSLLLRTNKLIYSILSLIHFFRGGDGVNLCAQQSNILTLTCPILISRLDIYVQYTWFTNHTICNFNFKIRAKSMQKKG